MATASKQKTKSKQVVAYKVISGFSGKGLMQYGKLSCLEMRDQLQMPRAVFRRIVNVSERTVAKVEATAKRVEKMSRPYNEVYRLYQALSEVVKAESLGAWFLTPNPALDGLKPIEVIERGEIDRLWEIAFRLRSGMPG